MKAKDFFRQVKRAKNDLKMLNAMLQHFKDIGISFSSAVGSIGNSGNRYKSASRVELSAVGTVDVLQDVEQRRREFSAIIARADRVIEMIPQEKYRQILRYRYLCGWSFRSISDELMYNDPNSVYRAHGWALIAAQAVLDKLENEKAAQE